MPDAETIGDLDLSRVTVLPEADLAAGLYVDASTGLIVISSGRSLALQLGPLRPAACRQIALQLVAAANIIEARETIAGDAALEALGKLTTETEPH